MSTSAQPRPAPPPASHAPEPRSFAELTRPAHGRLLQAALALCGDPDLAADLAQEALVRGYQAWDTFHPGARVYPWLARILRNVFIDHVRSARARHEIIVRDLPDPPGESTPLDALLASEQADILYGALAKLPPDYSLVVTLVDLQGMEYAEVAEITEVPVGTVRSRLSRGRARLREILVATR